MTDHFYEIAPGDISGTWHPYCAACSEKTSDYVYPCKLWTSKEVPPPRLHSEERVGETLREVLHAMVIDGKALIAPPGKVIRPIGPEGYDFFDEPRKINDVELP